MNKILRNSYPAARWQDATPLGNGRMGALVYGSVYDDTICINDENLFVGGKDIPIPDCTHLLKKVRSLLDAKRYEEANNLYPDFLDENYKARVGHNIPASDLKILINEDGQFCNYSRILDCERGIASISYIQNGNKISKEFFLSEHGLFCRICADKPLKNIRIWVEEHTYEDAVDAHGNMYIPKIENECGIVGKTVFHQARFAEGMYRTEIKLLSCDGTVSFLECEQMRNRDGMQGELIVEKPHIFIENARKIIFNVMTQTDCVSCDFFETDYLRERAEHTKYFSEKMNRIGFSLYSDDESSNEQLLEKAYGGSLPNALAEKFFWFSRYLFVSSAIGGQYPASLQGIWNGAYTPPWTCSFFNDENVPMCYWQMMRGALGEGIEPILNLYLSHTEDYRENAQKLYGCRGYLLPLYLDAYSGKSKTNKPHCIYWIGAGGWICSLIFEYFRFTRDENFLQRIYPFFTEVMNFYCDFIQIRDGKLYSYPSSSPENCADGDFVGAKRLRIAINPTMDFALLKELIDDLQEAAQVLHKEEDPRWEVMKNAIPDYRINSDGAFCEYLHEDFRDNYHHRHLSHIFPFFPGHEIDRVEDSKWIQSIEKAVDFRYSSGLKEQTGWSLIHLAAVYARLGNASKAEECLGSYFSACVGPNFFAYHNDWRNMGVTLKLILGRSAPYQAESNLGYASVIYEMLYTTDTGRLHILPALPKDWECGELERVRCVGGGTLSIKWGNYGKNIHLTLVGFKGKLYFQSPLESCNVPFEKGSNVLKINSDVCNCEIKLSDK